MQRSVARSAFFAAAASFVAATGAKDGAELYPCAALVRLGTMDESGTITRPTPHRELAAEMTRECDYVVLGRFVGVFDSHYDDASGDQPVVSSFDVSEVLRGKAIASVSVRVTRDMLVAPGTNVNRYLSSLESTADEVFRYDLATELERELTSVRDSGEPLTDRQHQRLTEGLKRMVNVPRRTRYEQYKLVKRWNWTNSPLSFHMELGAIRPDEVYLLGLNDQNTTGSPVGAVFNSLHSYLFWGQEAQDIAAALREKQE